MNRIKTFTTAALAAILLSAAGCATTRAQTTAELNAALQVAAAVENAYSVQPNADPKAVAELTRLLASAQAAVTSIQTATGPVDLTAANGAIAALVAYEASAHVTP
jgi:hypothetical protein